MKKKEKKKQGFAITGVLYSILLLFVVMLIGILNNLEGRKQLLDVMREDTIKASESDEAIKDLYEQINQLKKEVNETENKLYPIGSIYITTKKTNPSEYIGGTWIEWGKGRVPVGVDTSQGEFNTVEKTGGEKTHTLTINEMPSHTHLQNAHNHNLNFGKAFDRNNVGGMWNEHTQNHLISGNRFATVQADYDSVLAGYTMDSATATNQNTGGNQSHNNLQSYITAYMWKCTK